jgi:ribosome-associated protein
MTIEALELARAGREALAEKKAGDIVVLDVRKLSSISDFFVLATASNGPHLKALDAAFQEALAARGVQSIRRSGSPASGWIVCDGHTVVAHLLTKDRRRYYDLEQLWRDAPRVA